MKQNPFSSLYQYDLSPTESNQVIWEIRKTKEFNEQILSWNGFRPEVGKWIFSISLGKETEWSPWLKYAEWTASGQKTFKCAPEDSFAASYQDTVFPKEGLCDGFRVKVTAEEGAALKGLKSLHSCLSDLEKYTVAPIPSLPFVLLSNVPRQSQNVLDHPRHRDLCSPTSTSTAINYLLGRKELDPVWFAKEVHDDEFDIYGNWILNTAEAYRHLKGSYRVHVERLSDFSFLHAQLMSGCPVVVSVKGTIEGAPKPYPVGHLICVVGYDPKEQKVYCIDPAFPNNESTFIGYQLNDFLNAWGIRKNLAYVFTKSTPTKFS